MPLIKWDVMVLGKRALKTGMRIVDDAGSDPTLKEAVKRRVKETGTDLINRLLTGGSNSSGSGSGSGSDSGGE